MVAVEAPCWRCYIISLIKTVSVLQSSLIKHSKLVKAGTPLAYYKRDNSTLEMDFFVRSAGSLVPVEVKAENNRAKSLRTLIESEAYKDIRWGVKLVNGNTGFENKVLTLPQWCAFKLKEIIGKMEVAP